MRLLFVCKSLPHSFKGGIQTHVWELTKELALRGHQVTILTAGGWRSGTVVRNLHGRQIIHLPYFPGRKVPFLSKTLEDVSFNFAAFLWLRRHGDEYDRVHIQGRSGCFHAAFPPRRSHQIVTTFHRLIDVEYEYDGQRTGRLDGFLHRHIMGGAERAAARKSDHLIAVSLEMKQELLDYVPGKLAPTSIIPNGVDRKFGEHLVDKSRWQLVFVGRLEKIKGVYPLIRAMQVVDERIELVLIGDGPERKNLESLVREQDMEMRVKFLGDQESEAVRYWIQRSYALVLPSFHESQGIVLLEAGVCRRPVVAASAPGIIEVIQHGHNGLLFPPGDVESLGLVINHLFHNPPLAEQLGTNGLERVTERYDWKLLAGQTLSVYENIGVSEIGQRYFLEADSAVEEMPSKTTLPTDAAIIST